MARESAIRVITFSVIPRKFMTMNDEMTEMGRVSPVITVERQELRKRKTMKMVKNPTEDERLLNVPDRIPDHDRSVTHHLDRRPRRKFRLKPRRSPSSPYRPSPPYWLRTV